ncbi:unnamed protein product, partial [Didymodactylos carnosus]
MASVNSSTSSSSSATSPTTTPSLKDKRTVKRKRNDVWDYFEQKGDGLYCLLYKCLLESNAKSTGGMIYHLSKYHAQEHKIFRDKQPKRVRTDDILPLDSERSKFLTNIISEFIIRDLEPISFVNSSKTLRKLMKLIEPAYVIPTRNYFRDNVIRRLYEEVSTELRT